jgi:hypothetical protein
MRNGQSASVGVREIISAASFTLVEGPLSFFGPRLVTTTRLSTGAKRPGIS